MSKDEERLTRDHALAQEVYWGQMSENSRVKRRRPTQKDLDARKAYFASLSKRQLWLADYAPCNDNGIDFNYLAHPDEEDYEND